MYFGAVFQHCSTESIVRSSVPHSMWGNKMQLLVFILKMKCQTLSYATLKSKQFLFRKDLLLRSVTVQLPVTLIQC